MGRASLGVFWLALAMATGTASAQIGTPPASPVYHGILRITRAHGTIDRDTHTAVIRVPRWKFLLSPDTNGVFPAAEPTLIAIGDASATLEAGSLKTSRSGKTFSFRSALATNQNGVRNIRVWRRGDGSYGVRFTVTGMDLERLNREDPVCLPVAVIIGDDDGFSGVTFSSPSFFSKRLVLKGECPIGNDWPWLGR